MHCNSRDADEALKAYDRGVMFKPEDAELWTSMGQRVISGASRRSPVSFQHALKFIRAIWRCERLRGPAVQSETL